MMSLAAYWLYREKLLPFFAVIGDGENLLSLSPPFLRFHSASLFSWDKARALLVG